MSDNLKAISVLMIIAFFCSYHMFLINEQKRLKTEFENSFTQEIVHAQIDSPSIIIRISTLREFREKINELGVDTIYADSVTYAAHYYVFNEDLTIAWKFDPIYSQSNVWNIYSKWRLENV